MNELSQILNTLGDSELLSRTYQAAKAEQKMTIEVLYHLHAVHLRRLYAQECYSSLWDYLIRGLGYSEGSAGERISAMRKTDV